jgi:V/A-type H+-transporting ATPase subunit F
LSYKIAVIGDADTVTGFSLAGVRHVHVHVSKEETLSKLRRFLMEGDVGLLLITHRVIEDLGEDFKLLMRTKGVLPVVLAIPDKTGYAPAVDELYELIKRAVGARVTEKIGGD